MSDPLTFCTFKWAAPAGYRSTFEGKHVDTLARMVRRHYKKPHRFVCITDDARGIEDPGVEVYRLWDDLASIPNPSGAKNPSCFRRLRLFAAQPGAFLGERFVCMDLDTVILDDIEPLFDRPEDFVIWRGGSAPAQPYNGSMWMLKAGARAQVWREFDPATSPMEAKRAGRFGSDQGWIAHCLGNGEAVWTQKDGVYSYRLDLEQGRIAPPPDARIVFTHGRFDPWSRELQRLQWVRDHYQ